MNQQNHCGQLNNHKGITLNKKQLNFILLESLWTFEF